MHLDQVLIVTRATASTYQLHSKTSIFRIKLLILHQTRILQEILINRKQFNLKKHSAIKRINNSFQSMIEICQMQKLIWLGLKGIETVTCYQVLFRHQVKSHIYLLLIVEGLDLRLKSKNEQIVLHQVIQLFQLPQATVLWKEEISKWSSIFRTMDFR